MNDFHQSRIGEEFQVETGATPSTAVSEYWQDGNIKWITPLDLGKLSSTFISRTSRNITQKGLDNSSATLVPGGSIIISTRAPIGYLAVLTEPMAFNQGCKALVAKKGKPFQPLYIYYQLQTKVQEMNQLGSGSTFKEISKEKLESIKLQIPPLPIQKQIAAILEKADVAREKRRQANERTEQFLQSAFKEMFGDPATNPRGWEKKPFGRCIDSIRYATGSPPPYVDDGIAFIRATNVKGGTIVTNDLRYIACGDALKIAKCEVGAGDLILVRSGVNAGDCAIIPPEFDGAYAAYDLIIELPKPSAVFYNHLINSSFGKAIIEPLKRRAGQPHLNADQIKSLELPAPPRAKLQEFAVLVEKVGLLRAKQKESEKELENLFNSLMQRAFKGELV